MRARHVAPALLRAMLRLRINLGSLAPSTPAHRAAPCAVLRCPALPCTGYTHLGCYADASWRVLPTSLGAAKSVSECYAWALAGGYRAFGLQYGGSCFAGANLAVATSLGTSDACTMWCPSYQDVCGGPYASNVYSIGEGGPANCTSGF